MSTASDVARVQARFGMMANGERIEKALDKAAEMVAAKADKNVPVDHGEMKNATHIVAPSRFKRVVRNDTRQAVFTEYSPLLLKGGTVDAPRHGPWPYESDGKTKGTRTGATMPWLRPALWSSKQRILAMLRAAATGGKQDV